jgi:pyruvate/2-oxoglutarate dehydrogenase complex dihydrolipoamide dehydrogenase (E3) component
MKEWVDKDIGLEQNYDYELIVIGGGSGGIACGMTKFNQSKKVF